MISVTGIPVRPFMYSTYTYRFILGSNTQRGVPVFTGASRLGIVKGIMNNEY
jgi:hypothetical protein